MIPEPRNGSFHNPTMAIAAHGASILRAIFGKPVLAVWRDHFYAQLGERFIQSIEIICLIADQSLRLGIGRKKLQGLLHHRGLAHARRIDRDPQRNPLIINHQLNLRAFAFAGEPDGSSAAFGRGEGRIDKALLEVNAASLDQATNNSTQELAESFVLAPELKVVMHRRLRWKGRWQILPLDAGVENEEDRFEDRPGWRARSAKAILLRNLKDRP